MNSVDFCVGVLGTISVVLKFTILVGAGAR
jgi:hypothetical protein